MNPWLEWGIPLLTWIQNLGAWMEGPMLFFTLLGTEDFYLLVMPALLWCFDAGIGVRLGLMLLLSANLNAALKLGFGWPRPFWVRDEITAVAHESSFGMPSGHAQNAVALWGTLATEVRRRWVTTLCAALILLISLSRMVLGVHFPADVLGGWVVGGLLLALFLKLSRPFSKWLGAQPLAFRVLLPLLASLFLLTLGLGAAEMAIERGLPQAWIRGAGLSFPEAPPIAPLRLEALFSTAGVIFGFGAGAVLLLDWGRFHAGGRWWKRLGRYALGLFGVLGIYLGLRALFPQGETLIAQGLRYVRYAAVGFWISYLAPRAFAAVNLIPGAQDHAVE